MSTLIPSAESVREQLSPLDTSAVRALAQLSGVPFTTLWKVKSGVTKNPGIETVRAFVAHIDTVRSAARAAPEAPLQINEQPPAVGVDVDGSEGPRAGCSPSIRAAGAAEQAHQEAA